MAYSQHPLGPNEHIFNNNNINTSRLQSWAFARRCILCGRQVTIVSRVFRAYYVLPFLLFLLLLRRILLVIFLKLFLPLVHAKESA